MMNSGILVAHALYNSSTYTTSLTPSVTDFPEENGRRYHAFRAGSEWTQSPDGGDIADMLGYMLPNDEVNRHNY